MRSNRYTKLDEYPYPYCAYGLYPVDQTETWYFGFARDHDFRTDSPISSNDVIENFTEQRILRMVDDLVRQPPGPAVDTQRIYLFGHSMGGTGALAFAERYPNIFAAIYSGQPVTDFHISSIHKEEWPLNAAEKWGAQELNLPIEISARNHWADHLQKYNGVGVYDWEDLKSAFDPSAVPNRAGDEMVPFGIDHGTIDDAVLFQTQGQWIYPLLNASGRTWAGAITKNEHLWSEFGWPLPNMAKVNDVPFWNLQVIKDETTPGFSFLSTNIQSLPTAPTTYNQVLLWSASWNPWDAAPIDTESDWQMSFCTVKAGTQNCGGDQVVTVNITPRRLQHFSIAANQVYGWDVHRITDGRKLAEGKITATADGLITIKQVQIPPNGVRVHIFKLGE